MSVAGSAAAALAILVRNGMTHFHIILLDQILPDARGTELLPQLRALVGEETAVLIVSVHSHVRAEPSQTPVACAAPEAW